MNDDPIPLEEAKRQKRKSRKRTVTMAVPPPTPESGRPLVSDYKADFNDLLAADPTGASIRKARSVRARSGPVTEMLIEAGKLPTIVDKVEIELGLTDAHDIFQRGGALVHVAALPVPAADSRKTVSHRVVVATVPYVVDELTRIISFLKFDARKELPVPCNCPNIVAETLLSRGTWPTVRQLHRIVSAPTLRHDRSVLARPGYDEATGLLVDFGDERFPEILETPTRDDALAALATLKGLLGTFPFVLPADLSVALCAILTSVVRASLPTAPIFAITAPVAGSGKSLLVDLIVMISSGNLAPVISQGRSEEEFEKRLAAALLAGDASISIDNCEHPLGGALLCQAATQQVLKIRVMGLSLNLEVPATSMLFATGNNLVLTGDVTRRALVCSLDPQCERPELREFDSDPLRIVREERGRYVVAALTIMRAHALSQFKGPPPLGSFVEWSRFVRDALLWLGEADPCDTMAKTRAADPRRTAFVAVLDNWEKTIGEAPVTGAAVIRAATSTTWNGTTEQFTRPEFRDALLEIAARGQEINAKRLGWWLLKNEGTISQGRRIVKHGKTDGSSMWRLELVENGD